MAAKETHLLDVFDCTAPVIRLPYSFVFHTSNTFSDPSIQFIKYGIHCTEFSAKIINCAPDHSI